MPELPEVTTTVRGLKKEALGLTILDIWTGLAKNTVTRNDFRESFKYLPYFKNVYPQIKNTVLTSVERRAKYIFIHLSNNKTLVIHLKMTGHLMIGKYMYTKKENTWTVAQEEENDALRDPFNRFIHVAFSLSDGRTLVFCDARKFGNIRLIETVDFTDFVAHLGPEPLEDVFDSRVLKAQLLKRGNTPLKTVLLDQRLISGIGNIYADEALWLAGIHPTRTPKSLTDAEYKTLCRSIKKALHTGLESGGDSTSDYRNIYGEKGGHHRTHNAYQKTGTLCKKKGCSGVIQRILLGGRSTHFCSAHQQ